MTRQLAGDRVLRLLVAAWAAALLLRTAAHSGWIETGVDVAEVVDHGLVWLTLIALVWGRRTLDRTERRFWDILALAWGCWLLLDWLFFLDVSLPAISASFTTDALHILFYLAIALAVDLRPDTKVERSLQRVIRRLETGAGVIAVFGVLIYFAIVVLPEPLGLSLSFVPRESGFTPLLLVRLTLDLVLTGRLVFAAARARFRWRRIYGFLAAGMLCLAIRDGLAVLVAEGVVPVVRLGLPYEFFLSLSPLCVVVAARYRHLSVSDRTDGAAATEIPEEQALRTSPVVLYAIVVPALHFLLYPLGVLEPSSREPREVFSLGFVVVLGLIGWVHQTLVVKDSRRARLALRKTEERLFRSQRVESIGRLAGGIAHDFNNYLTVIRGYCELVRDRLHDPAALEQIGHVEDAADRATKLTRQLLAFGRRQVLRPEALDLNAVIHDTRKLLESLLGEDVILQLELDPEVGHAIADHGQTEQVLMNLALNGRDAMPRGGTLTLRTRRRLLSERQATEYEIEPGPYVALEVEDNGCGMDEEVLSQAFEPFFTTKGQGRGTGLGLSTVYGIVAQSGGNISLDSVPGRGTTARVLFPVAATESSSATSASTEPAALRPPAATLLVVEDNEQVRNLAVSALTASGFRVHEAAGGGSAIELFERHPAIDLLITDVMMAGMDGVQLADVLLSRRPGLRVLFISGYPLETLRERQTVLPRSIELLEKPFTAATLVAKTREVLAQRLTGERTDISDELQTRT